MKNHLAIALLGTLAALCSLSALADGTTAGTVTLVTGHASAATAAGGVRDLVKGGPVYAGETIITSASSFVNIEFTDGGRILLRPESRFAIERYQFSGTPGTTPAAGAPQAPQESAFFHLLKGGFRAVSGLIGHVRHEDYAVQTPVATIGIRGTDYEIRYCNGDCGDIQPTPANGLYAGVNAGAIGLTNGNGTTVTGTHQYTFIGGSNVGGQNLGNRPPALGKNALPDPKTCN